MALKIAKISKITCRKKGYLQRRDTGSAVRYMKGKNSKPKALPGSERNPYRLKTFSLKLAIIRMPINIILGQDLSKSNF
jgi:hypothetical protein